MSAFRKLFGRRKDKEPERGRLPANADDSSLRTSAYDTAPTGGAPKTGAYPIKGNGNGSTPALAGRQTSQKRTSHSTRRSEIPSTVRAVPPMPQDRPRSVGYNGPRASPNAPAVAPNVAPGTAVTTNRNPVEDNYSSTDMANRGLQRDGQSPSVAVRKSSIDLLVAARTLTRPEGQVPPTAPAGPRQYNEGIAKRNTMAMGPSDLRSPEYSYLSAVYGTDVADRNVADGHRTNSSSAAAPMRARNNEEVVNANSGFTNEQKTRGIGPDRGYINMTSQTSPTVNHSPTPQFQPDEDLTRKASIPRKLVGSESPSPSSPSNSNKMSIRNKPLPYTTPPQQRGISEPSSPVSPSQSPSHTRNSSVRDKPLPATPPDHRGLPSPEPYRPAHHTGGNRGLAISGATEKPSLEGIVDLSNTVDTEVIERIAPAVIHEDVTKEIHHIREEVITREIHTHDIYHRIQPVIDVEVLPPRHFLPVEGGGLVEVSADEVPGRHGNWVIAETASKIPSDEPAPIKPMRFTAAEFDESWDKKTFVTPEGFERTEEVWVHPPELETGAWATGQTWRMDFDKPEESAANGVSTTGALGTLTKDTPTKMTPERGMVADGPSSSGYSAIGSPRSDLPTSQVVSPNNVPKRKGSLRDSSGPMNNLVEKQNARGRRSEEILRRY
ncbi:MAG: hypothetical protein M1827_002232 [Pycnora praestabilis]|nr:MAG: hypothetical protein M1827_002232 [Pycnora praestabilis]